MTALIFHNSFEMNDSYMILCRGWLSNLSKS